MAAYRVGSYMLSRVRNSLCNFSFSAICTTFSEGNTKLLSARCFSSTFSSISRSDSCVTNNSGCDSSLLASKPQGHLQASSLHTSVAARGLDEFFDDEKNWGQPTIKAGRAWSLDEIRTKDYVTLHKLWYVLVKERNMLLTMEAEAERLEKFLPSPERLNKVDVSMAHIKAVLKERQEALTELKTGHKEEHPGTMQYTPFGYKRYVKPREYPVPVYMNKRLANKRQTYNRSNVGRYLTRWYEQSMKQADRARRRKIKNMEKLKEQFPDSDVWENK